MANLKFPNALTIIIALIVIVAMSTYLIPSGKFDRKFDESLKRDIVVAGTYKPVTSNYQGYSHILTSLIKGIKDAAEIIAYVLIVGGAYGIIISTGSLKRGLLVLMHKFGSKIMLLIPLLMVLFAIGGTTTGMWEETLVFYSIIVSLMVIAGFDALLGVAIVVLGAGSGVLASTINPFATGIASQIAEISLKDGMGWRIVAWVCVVTASILYVLWYARKIKLNPNNSLISKQDREIQKTEILLNIDKEASASAKSISFRDMLVICGFLANIAIMMYGVINWGWYIEELSMSFLSLALFCSIVFKISQTKFWEAFIAGASDMVSAALIIGFARGIIIIANDGNIIDTFLYGISSILNGVSRWNFIIINQLVQLFVGVFVPSSSGHAALTVSIMAPLADLFLIPRSAVVSAMQFASGMANLFTPTSGVLMAALAIGKVKYVTWLRFVLPLVAIHFIITSIILVLSVTV